MTFKYNGSAIHRRACLHHIGVTGEVSVEGAAQWMNVSRTTAMRYLRRMEARGEIKISQVSAARRNTWRYSIQLHERVLDEFEQGTWSHDYRYVMDLKFDIMDMVSKEFKDWLGVR